MHSENPKKDSRAEAANHYHGSSLVLREKGRSLPVLSSDRWFTCILRTWGERYCEEGAHSSSHLPTDQKYFSILQRILVPMGAQWNISPLWRYFLHGSEMESFTNGRITQGKLVSGQFLLKPHLKENSNYNWGFVFFNMWKSILLKVNLATYVRRFISKWNFQKCIKYPHWTNPFPSGWGSGIFGLSLFRETEQVPRTICC